MESPSAGAAGVVREMLEALAVPDVARVQALLAPDVEWRNTGLPTVRGARVHQMIAGMPKWRIGFGVDFHDIEAEGNHVVTLRRDYLAFGPVLRQAIEIEGHFTVENDRITLWDDRFSWAQTLLSTRLGKR
jgi:limonene-1,2-epoxide hydrolase